MRQTFAFVWTSRVATRWVLVAKKRSDPISSPARRAARAGGGAAVRDLWATHIGARSTRPPSKRAGGGEAGGGRRGTGRSAVTA